MGRVIVLDASALLTVILRETGMDVVLPRLPQSVIGAANLAEALARMAQEGADPDFYHQQILRAGVRIDAVTDTHALEAARLRPLTKHLGLSLGDRLCLGLARTLNLPVLTTDRIWLQYDFGIPVEVAR